MFTFNLKYFLLACLLFVTEVLIAIYIHDQIIRPYIGDVLVVILIYCFVKSFINAPVGKTAISVLIFSYLIEMMQYFKLVNLLGLRDSRLANIVIGNSFSWGDIVAYTIGTGIILLAERFAKTRVAAK